MKRDPDVDKYESADSYEALDIKLAATLKIIVKQEAEPPCNIEGARA